jgi:hypothetical protein
MMPAFIIRKMTAMELVEAEVRNYTWVEIPPMFMDIE